jgi:hypothetical protein
MKASELCQRLWRIDPGGSISPSGATSSIVIILVQAFLLEPGKKECLRIGSHTHPESATVGGYGYYLSRPYLQRSISRKRRVTPGVRSHMQKPLIVVWRGTLREHRCYSGQSVPENEKLTFMYPADIFPAWNSQRWLHFIHNVILVAPFFGTFPVLAPSRAGRQRLGRVLSTHGLHPLMSQDSYLPHAVAG